jgi:hypothetical protein
MADVNAFLSDCVEGGTQASCNAWLGDNPTCSACIAPMTDAGAGENSGALLFDSSSGEADLNVPGCVQLVDGNTTCAAPLEELTLCELAACDSVACQMADQTDYTSCTTAADNLACASQVMAANTGCGATDSADGGALSVCQGNTTQQIVALIYKICGNGM